MVCLAINVDWIPVLLGLLQPYRYPEHWTGTLEENRDARRKVIDLLAILADATEGNCMAVKDVRMNGCLLQITTDGSSWITVGDLSGCAIPGPKGDKGDKGDQGIPGPPGQCTGLCGPSAPQREPGESGAGVRCGVAINISKYLRNKIIEIYTDGDDAIDGLANGTTVAAAVVALFFPAAAVAAGVIGVLINILRAITRLDNLEIGAFDNAWEERIRCMLFCLLPDSGDLSPEILEQWAAQVRADSQNPFSGYAADIIINVGFDYFQWIAWASPAVDAQACQLCDCPDELWCYEFNFLLESGGFTPIPHPNTGQIAIWGSSGWVGYYHPPSGDDCVTSIRRDFAFPLRLTRIAVEYETSGNCAPYGCSLTMETNAGWNFHRNPLGVGLETTIWEGDSTFADLALTLYLSGQEPGIIRKLRLEGLGVNPFGTDNCA